MLVSDIKFLNQKELKKLFTTIKRSNDKHSLRNLCIFRLAYRCGLRASEVGILRVEDFNIIKGELYCTRLKNSLNNTIFLGRGTTNILKRYIKESNLKEGNILFCSQEKKPISRKLLHHLMKKYCKEAGIKDKEKWHFHCLKHSIAVHLAESGLDVKEIQYWLGHRSINSTLIYFQFTTSQQEHMLKKLKSNSVLVE